MIPKLKAHDWVVVKSPAEILATLDADGTLDGLPFMPEMLEMCGRKLQVAKVASKICVEYSGRYKMNEFRNNDVVILDASRCSGSAHGGCQRLCVLFWKTAWLTKATRTAENGPNDTPKPSALERLAATLTTRREDGRYVCQSSEMDRATQPITRTQVLVKCFEDVRSGSRTVLEMIRLILIPTWRYITNYRFRGYRPTGTLRQTPVEHLDLKPGELVRIKNADDIVKTVDSRGCNRGLLFHSAMSKYFGQEHRVSARLDRMITECNGHMRKVEGTVMLEGLNCPCMNHVGGCPRGDLIYWRESWLERVEEQVKKPAEEPREKVYH